MASAPPATVLAGAAPAAITQAAVAQGTTASPFSASRPLASMAGASTAAAAAAQAAVAPLLPNGLHDVHTTMHAPDALLHVLDTNPSTMLHGIAPPPQPIYGAAAYGASPSTDPWWLPTPYGGQPPLVHGAQHASLAYGAQQPPSAHGTQPPSEAHSVVSYGVFAPTAGLYGAAPASPWPTSSALSLAYAYPTASVTAPPSGASSSYGVPYGSPSAELVASSVLPSGSSPSGFYAPSPSSDHGVPAPPFDFAHLIPVKLTTDNYLLWRAQALDRQLVE
nr:extensin-2-like [Aegilops tauschii subsp. strangulata]